MRATAIHIATQAEPFRRPGADKDMTGMAALVLDTLCETALDVILTVQEVDPELVELSEACNSATDEVERQRLGVLHDARMDQIEAEVLSGLGLAQAAYDEWFKSQVADPANWTESYLAEVRRREARRESVN